MGMDTAMVADGEDSKQTLYVVNNNTIVSNAVNGSLDRLVNMVEKLDRQHEFLETNKTIYLVNRHTGDLEAALPLILEAVDLPSSLDSEKYEKSAINYMGPEHHTLKHLRKILGVGISVEHLVEALVFRMKVPDSGNEKAAKVYGKIGSLTVNGKLHPSLYDTAGIKFTVGGTCVEDEHERAREVLKKLEKSPYITFVEIDDYYAKPKASGFRSLNVKAQYVNGVDMKLEFQIQGTERALQNTLEHKQYGDRRLIENGHGDLSSRYQVIFVDNRAVVEPGNPNVRMLFKEENVTGYRVNDKFGPYTLLVVPGDELSNLSTCQNQAQFFRNIITKKSN